MMNDKQRTGWCILRMQGPRTLRVADSLNAADLEAWTPTMMIEKRRSRSSLKLDVRMPIAPTFVFLRGANLPIVRAAMAQPINPFPAFSVYQYAGAIPFVSDAAIDGLRTAEATEQVKWDALLARRAVAKARGERDAGRRKLKADTVVSVRHPAFTGLTGVVEGGSRKEAVIYLGGGLRMKVDTWLLVEDELEATS